MFHHSGKSLQNQESIITLEDHRPGCMKGILHHFNHPKWNHVKKKLPHKKHSSGKPNTNSVGDPESNRSGSDGGEMQENTDTAMVETKSTGHGGSVHKSSMKSRIKALITEEMSKRRGRHRRSSSCPGRTLERTSSIHHIEPLDPKPLGKSASKEDVSENQESYQMVSLLDREQNKGFCKLCAMMNSLKQKEAHKQRRQPIPCSSQEPKLFLDALDLLDVRKEVFLKILQDPNSSLAHQLRSRRTSNLSSRLTKSMSFPMARTYDGIVGEDHCLIKRGGASLREEDEPLGCGHVPDEMCKHLGEISELEIPEISVSASGKVRKKRHEGNLAVKQFKNLQEKIKHVIRDRKKEKHRIIMDAALHKIPCESGIPKDVKAEGGDNQELEPDRSRRHDIARNRGTGYDSGRFKRTSSFNDSFDRYKHLIETSSGKEASSHVSERRFRTNETVSPARSGRATLGRILSLPDLRGYSYTQSEDLSAASSPLNQGSTGAENSKLPGKKQSGLDLETKIQSSAGSETGNRDDFVDVEESFDDRFAETCTDSSLKDAVDEQQTKMDSGAFTENMDGGGGGETVETQIKKFQRVASKHKTEFNYVRDVLELSGFTADSILGKWHSDEHPVDPSLFDEVRGCPATPVTRNEEERILDFLLLFDIINEVLLRIYEKSFCYCPERLTCQSRVRVMPVGDRVFEEVWAEISCFLNWAPEIDASIDDVVVRDLHRGDEWMNLQFDAECVGMELEDLIFDDLLQEAVAS